MSQRAHAPLLRDLQETLFRPSGLSGDGPPLVGAELEVFPVFGDTGRRVPTLGVAGSFMTVLRPLAHRLGWRERMSAKGTSVFDMPGGSRLTFEPGGQVELSLAPRRSVSRERWGSRWRRSRAALPTARSSSETCARPRSFWRPPVRRR